MAQKSNHPIISRYLKSGFAWGEDLTLNDKVIPYQTVIQILRKVKEEVGKEKFTIFQLHFLSLSRKKIEQAFPFYTSERLKLGNNQVLTLINQHLLQDFI